MDTPALERPQVEINKVCARQYCGNLSVYQPVLKIYHSLSKDPYVLFIGMGVCLTHQPDITTDVLLGLPEQQAFIRNVFTALQLGEPEFERSQVEFEMLAAEGSA